MKRVTNGWKLTVYSVHTQKSSKTFLIFFFHKKQAPPFFKTNSSSLEPYNFCFKAAACKSAHTRNAMKKQFPWGLCRQGKQCSSCTDMLAFLPCPVLELRGNYRHFRVLTCTLTLSARAATRDPLERMFQSKLVSTMIYETSYKKP